ncbi:ornithine cyclodeaminase family protein [Piscibacillus sp. B03]|uniref:ornithine cyclodeaminase family protein n=1 Tax=Piscibacillus sp. B03 TaxID=3457430 RepID=UPI003FCDD126
MKYLNEEAIWKCVTMSDVIDAIDESYRVYDKGSFEMPTRSQIQDGDNTLILMPCMSDSSIGTKLVTSFPNNKTLPTLHSLVILNDHDNGSIQSIMDGGFLTGLRTGAIGGSAVRHLAKQNARSLAVIGTGVQGYYQTLAACSERNIQDIYLYNRSIHKIPDFIEKLRPHVSSTTRFHICQSTDYAVQKADIIITATTSKTPVLPKDDSLYHGKLVIGVGSFQPTMQEFPNALFSSAQAFYIDSHDAKKESGDVINPIKNGLYDESGIQPFSEVIKLEMKPEQFNYEEGSVIFKSTGMALFDVVVASDIYERSTELNVGTEL